MLNWYRISQNFNRSLFINDEDYQKLKNFNELKNEMNQEYRYSYNYNGKEQESTDKLKDIIYKQQESYIKDVQLLESL